MHLVLFADSISNLTVSLHLPVLHQSIFCGLPLILLPGSSTFSSLCPVYPLTFLCTCPSDILISNYGKIFHSATSSLASYIFVSGFIYAHKKNLNIVLGTQGGFFSLVQLLSVSVLRLCLFHSLYYRIYILAVQIMHYNFSHSQVYNHLLSKD